MWGDILSTMEDVQYRGVYHDKCGVFSTLGVILSAMEDTQYRGEYHDARNRIS